MNRRAFLRDSALGAAAIGWSSLLSGCRSPGALSGRVPFQISLVESSLRRSIREEKSMTNLDFPKFARRAFGLDAIEYVNDLWPDNGGDERYLAELKRVCEGEGVRSLLIKCDQVGNLGDSDPAARKLAADEHNKWARVATALGCHSIGIGVGSQGVGTFDEQQKHAADGLRQLCKYCASLQLNCLVENRGGLSSNGEWLAGLVRKVGMRNCGTLANFGYFRIAPGQRYNPYQGIAEIMPFARAVSAQMTDFDEQGNEARTDIQRLMRIVVAARYHRHVGIEYEGMRLCEADGILASKRLLERLRDQFSG